MLVVKYSKEFLSKTEQTITTAGFLISNVTFIFFLIFKSINNQKNGKF